MSSTSFPGKSADIANNSTRTHPIDHISIEFVYFVFPNNNSGGLFNMNNY